MTDETGPAQPVDLAAVDAALAAVVEGVRRQGAQHPGVTVLKAHVGTHSQGGSLRHVAPDARLGTYADLDLLPALGDAAPRGRHGLAVEVQTQPDGWWQAVLCWADDLNAFAEPQRVLVDHVQEPAVPDPLPDVPFDRSVLARCWAAAHADHEPSAPASADEIERTARVLGFPVPAPLLALVALGDGLPLARDGGLLQGWQPSSLAEVRRTWEQDRALARDPLSPFDLAVDRSGGAVQARHHHPAWVPFADDGAGNVLVVDLAPGPAGRPGQVLETGRDLYDGARLVAWSLEDLLQQRTADVPPRVPRLVVDVRKTGGGALAAEQLRPDVTDAGLFGFDLVRAGTLAAAPGLQQLVVRTRALDLAGVERLPLAELRVLDAEQVDLRPLAGHPTLTRLSLGDLAPGAVVTGLDALADVPGLTHLQLPTEVWASAAGYVRDHPALLVATFDQDAPLGRTLQVAAAFDRPGRVLADAVLVRTA